MINQIIGVFFPSIIGNIKCANEFGAPQSKRQYIERYLILVLFTNLISYIITIWIFKEPHFEYTNQFTAKYIILSVIISYILPIVGNFLRMNFNISLVVKKNEK